MTFAEAIAVLDRAVPDPSKGLPDEVFYYISRTTPLLNVDLLIKDETGRTLLSWRNDQYCGAGWHIPGGIVRFKETMETRLLKVAEREIGRPVDFDPVPIKITEMLHPERANRSHFVSFLFSCHLSSDFVPSNAGLSPGDVGFLEWHKGCPDCLIRYHQLHYGAFI
ncbi:NUDIX domain-containing protein [Telmatospirillum siberiense]|uniref:NUDIX hydrolase n=1 Tax=Telmatospirillum siberiense TaxID=382514 RepID=A0A2N3Q024_9PROT|nr:NUDIX domain-containing protein [Telmatospirillum siberiense]PKU25992.1 NUDIX hydrolase [Telmatospirillum siberiense]